MTVEELKQYQAERRQLWREVYAALAALPDVGGDTCTEWADKAVARYDKRFNPETE